MNGVLVLSRMEALKIFRNRRVLIFTIAMPVVLFLAFGGSAGDKKIDGVPFRTYYMVAMASYGALAAAFMGNAMRIANENKSGWIRQLRLTALPGSGYFVAKLAAAMVTTVPSVLVVFGIGAAQGVKLEAWKWVALAVSIWIGSLIFLALALAVGLRFDPDTAQPVVMLIYFPMAILGGMWGPIGGDGLQKWVGRWIPTGAVRQIGQDIVFKGSTSVMPFLVIAVWAVVFSALAAATFRMSQGD